MTTAAESNAQPISTSFAGEETAFQGRGWSFVVAPGSASDSVCYTLTTSGATSATSTTTLSNCLATEVIENVHFEATSFASTGDGSVVAGILADGYEIASVKQAGGGSPIIRQVKGKAFAMLFQQEGDVTDVSLKKNGVTLPCTVVEPNGVSLLALC